MSRRNDAIPRPTPAPTSAPMAAVGRDGTAAPWLLTASGRCVPIHPHAAAPEIAIRDIANHLAKIARFAGATLVPYSVAQHAMLVSDVLASQKASARVALLGLMGDAHKAYMGEITAPARRAMTARSGVDTYAWIAAEMGIAIRAALHLPDPTEAERAAIGYADLVALATERRDLLPDGDGRSWPLPDAHPKPIKVLSWEAAEAAFLRRYSDLTAMAGVATR